MKGSEIENTLPPGYVDKDGHRQVSGEQIARLDNLLLQHAVMGHYVEPVMFLVQATPTFAFSAMRDALHWGEAGDAFRGIVSHRTAQWIADRLKLLLPTSKLVDLAYAASIKPAPQLMTPDQWMATRERMMQHSMMVDSELRRLNVTLQTMPGPNVCKHWVNTDRLKAVPRDSFGIPLAANYGWHELRAIYRNAVGAPIWQNVGLGHNLHHLDYSQKFWAVGRMCWINGVQHELTEVALDPKLCAHVSYEGPVAMRHPAVPLFDREKLTIEPVVFGSSFAPHTEAGVPYTVTGNEPTWRNARFSLGQRLIAWIGSQMVTRIAVGDLSGTAQVQRGLDAASFDSDPPLELREGSTLADAAREAECWCEDGSKQMGPGDLCVVGWDLAVVLIDTNGTFDYVTWRNDCWTRDSSKERPNGFAKLTSN